MAQAATTTSDVTTIVIAVLGSSLLSSLLTKLFDLKINRDLYEREYYKKIIDRRLNAYEVLSNALSSANGNYDREGQTYNIIFDSSASFEAFYNEIEQACKLKTWFNLKTWNSLSEFISYLNGITNESSNFKNNDHEIQTFGIRDLKKFESLQGNLEDLIMDDIFNASNIANFIKDYKSTQNKK